MKTYPVGVAVPLEIPLVDLNGAPLVPTGLSYVVRDQEGVILSPMTVVPVTSGMTAASFTVASEVNSIITELVEARVVILSVVTASGTHLIETAYLLSKPNRLEVMTNSFQTLPQAHAEAAMMPNLVGWETSTDPERATAMIEAYVRLTRLGYRVRRPEDVDVQNTIGDLSGYTEIIEPRLWPLIDRERWNSSRYTNEFRRALRRAQVAEANEILRGDRVNEKRRSGILSETIGESSMMFRIGKPLDLGISAAALEYVTGFVQSRITLTRS